MTTLHDQVKAEAERRLALARAAEEWSPSPWRYRSVSLKNDAIVDQRGGWVLTFAHHYEPTTFVVDFLTAHDPADAIRRHEAALRILKRHVPASPVGNWVGCSFCDVDGGAWRWPCDDFRDLAASYGIPIDDQEQP